MAGKSIAKTVEPELPETDMDAFVEVLQINLPALDSRNKENLRDIFRAFLGSLNRRDKQNTDIVKRWAEHAELRRLLGDKPGVTAIATQADADSSAAICNALAGAVATVTDSCELETSFFYKFHSVLTTRRGKNVTALNGFISRLKEGSRVWLLREKQKIAQAEAVANKAIEETFGSNAPPVQLDKPRIAGFTPKDEYTYKIASLLAVVKLVAKGKAPIELLQINHNWLKGDVKLNHARALKTVDGKSYLYAGTVEVVEDINLSRRG